ncbi:MAG: DNA topoisomerase I [Candidatus Taylorbacteria bacterium CG11_big_fil_rev_8_21_14_0_20_46_11]|uniref:DNA topoisomerase 1 n=1 Tax=Candidatus Taylorbacteria bacterium CG11_big_fil_rev_8_21_14_0_20_46_11 TaxID=1975025 RepID=A0A2H0KCF9_9BACT|nr:MAG: DNA topoisomerase I [Candidatus Taylorbacteria bacterium CG11_big_fil_rev_8_21_14_0_20_46_11]
MSKLLIVESPSKAKTIGKYLGSEYTVKASVGHVRDLPKSQKTALDIKGGFIPHYEIVKKKVDIVDEIVSEAKKASEIILATDPDREGEAIAWHLSEILHDRLKKKLPPMKRAVYHEITKEAIEEALKHPRDIDQNLRKAQEARRVLDRLVGYDLSGIIWKKVRYGLSAGRVQSPALRIIVEREREIRAFIPETFFVITADTETDKKVSLKLTCAEEPRDSKVMEHILDAGKKGVWSVTDVTETSVKRSPKAPFITSTLQQASSTRLGFSPGRTMGIAQKLYEGGFITYMRTDSTNLAETAKQQIVVAITKEFGKEFVQLRSYAGKVKNAQEAHEAIRPTHFEKMSAGSNPEQKELYELIWKRTVASQMPDAEMLRTKISANIATGDIPNFSANGVQLTYDGWLRADPEARGEDVELPKVATGDTLTLLDLRSEEKQTQPPSRYSEAGLIKELEKRGIGRPSTYASIMETLVDREYATKESRSLKPTDTGMVVSGFLEEHFASYISDTFTAEIEDELDDIAIGKREYEKTLRDFYTPFHKDVQSKESLDKATTLGNVPPEFMCPLCKGPLIWKLGRGGTFMSCARFPECTGALTAEGHEIKPDEPIGIYPPTGEPIFLLNGRFGFYVQVGPTPPKASKGKKAGKEAPKLRRASVPKAYDVSNLKIGDALKFLSLPRILGVHPTSEKEISANVGRFGPYVVHNGDFRSIKAPDDPYTIELPRALEMLAQEKKPRGFRKKKKE